ncbi:MAG: TIGR03118 family protein [Cyanobacteria bacterium J06560_2]
MESDRPGYAVTNLVSNNPDNNPQLLDPYMSLGWGIAIRPAGLGGHFWINNSGTGTVTEYVGDVSGVPLYQDSLKVVEVTPTEFNPFQLSGPTGQVFNGSDDFIITQAHADGDITAPSKFIFVATDGGISAWTERRNEDGSIDRPLQSTVVVDKFGESIFYGAAITDFDENNRLYAVDFGPTPGVEVYDADFNEITDDFEFINPFLDEGYAEYNIQNINDSLFVAYAIPSAEVPGDELIEAGLGRIAEFDLAGNLISTWNDAGSLNAPWGFVVAPDDFGKYSNMLLVSNFGDGTITAFDPATRRAVDYMRDDSGAPIAIDGLWGLTFGNGGSLGETNDLYFAAGNDLGENAGDGVFGKVEVAAEIDQPAPGGNQTFEGTAEDDAYAVSGDNNLFLLGDGNNIVTARGNDQTVETGTGDDIVSIGSGTVDLGEGNNFVTASAGSVTVNAGAGDDTVNSVKGGLNADLGEGNNHVTTGAGDDLIITGAGNDIVHAGAGNNTIDVGAGDNTINTVVNQGIFQVSVGQNIITTGNGQDTFRVGPGIGQATITNFDERDRFELVGFKSDFSLISFSDLAVTQNGDNTEITLAGTDDIIAVLQSTSAETITPETFGVQAITPELPVVSFTATPDSLNEAAGTPITFTFKVTGDLPEEGIIIRTDETFFPNSQVDFNIDLFSIEGLEFTDFSETETGQFIVDWRLTLPEVSIETTVFDDAVAELDSSFTTGLLPIPDANYTLDPGATTATISVTDGVESTGGPVVSLMADRTDVKEGEPLTLTISVEGDIPAEGLDVFINGDTVAALGDFITVDESGLPLVEIEGLAGLPTPNADGSGFIATVVSDTATIGFTVFDDGENEGPETFEFSLLDGEIYDVNGTASRIAITIEDAEAATPPNACIEGTDKRDRLFGTEGNDTITALAGNDAVFGDAGNDTIDGGSERDRLFGEAGNDILTGGSERDALFGGDGRDILAGGSGRDRLFGGEERDVLIGDSGNDFLSGGAGDDVLMGVTGRDTLKGGAGADLFIFGVGDGIDRIKDFEIGTDKIGLVEGELTFADLTITQAGNRTLLGVSSSGETLAILRGVSTAGLGESSFEIVANVATVEEAMAIL